MLELIKKILGESRFKKFRQWGYRLKFALYGGIDQENFQNFLTAKMELSPGDTLFVHSSLDKLNLSFPKAEVLEILLNIVGDRGTLLFPSWHFNYRAEEYLKDPNNVFDVKKSFSCMGLLTEIARRHPQAQRSLHPTNSVVAIGYRAKELIKDHHLSVYPNGTRSPFYKIMDYNGKVVGLGERAMHSLSFVHCIEDVYQDDFPFPTRPARVFDARVHNFDGILQIVPTKAAHAAIAKRNVLKYLKKYFSSNEVNSFLKGGSPFFVVNSNEFYRKMENLTNQGITIYD